MPCDYDTLPHHGIRTLQPYVPGKSSDELAREKGLTDIIKLASNENSLGCSPCVVDALAHLTAHQIASYPMTINHPLRQKLSDKLCVDSSMVILGNGSDSLFGLLLTCFALHTDKHIMTHDYAFSSYAIQAKTLGIPVISTPTKANWDIDVDVMISQCTEKTALIFIANPNNPTGLLVPQSDIKRLLDNIPSSTLLILDEAYYEYLSITEKINSIDLLKKHTNLVITRTFSKAYGLAGLRLGYGIANSQITAMLYRIQLPFVVNIAAITAASAALDDEDFLKKTLQMNASGLQQIQNGLDELGLKHIPASGNFVTFNCGTDSMPIYLNLQNEGIILRPLHPYGLNNYFRVTIGTHKQNTRFIEMLSKHLPHL